MRLLVWLAIVWATTIMPAAAQPAGDSAIVAVEVAGDAPIGTFEGIAFHRLWGVVRGTVAADEPVAGLSGPVDYASAFEIVLPVDPAQADGVLVEAENRGAPGLLATLNSAPRAPVPSPPGEMPVAIGDGFVFAQRLSFARVQWQYGIAPDVPAGAQGVGEVVLRDFGRLLAGGFPDVARAAALPVFRHRLLIGVSQSAWMVNSVIADGFNRDPSRGGAVYQGVFTRNGIGAVLAINRFAGDGPQYPYLPLDRPPLTPRQLLTRPDSDPLLVDLASVTDFYRLRASVFADAPGVAGLHRYATAAAHAPAGLAPDALIFGALKCNGGVPVPLNPTADAGVARALVVALASKIGARVATSHALPPDAGFVLAAAPADGVNPLAGVALKVPRMVDGQPQGGVVLPDIAFPLGAADPPALPPVGTTSITDVCGNFGGWRALDGTALTRRYATRAAYLDKVAAHTDRLIADGYLLARDRASTIAAITARLPAEF